MFKQNYEREKCWFKCITQVVFFEYNGWKCTFVDMQHQTIIALGSNLGDRKANITKAIQLIGNFGEVQKISSIYETPPWGYSSSKSYFNACILLETTLDPFELLNKLLEIEQNMGRVRNGDGYSDRPIDLDILFYADRVISAVNLELPHPRM